MTLTFKDFFTKNCNVAIIVSFLVFKLLSLFYEKIFNPMLILILDPYGSIRQQSYYIGNQEIRYGVFLTYLIIILALIYGLYFVSSIK